MDKQVKKQKRIPLKKQLAKVMPRMKAQNQNRERNKHQERSR